MNFNIFFDLMTDLSDSDSENYNDASITTINDMDLGSCLSYTLDKTKASDEEYLSNIEELMDLNDVKDYKIEDNNLIIKVS